MRINNISTPIYKNNQQNPSFGVNTNSAKEAAKKGFEWLGNQCNIQSNGSLTRPMFFAVGTLFMLGGRFIESRDNDERREVITRDVPGVAIACAGAPLLNDGASYLVTKYSGIPIAQTKNIEKAHSVFNSAFSSQAQITNWYSDFAGTDNALVNFSETIDRQNGNLKKILNKFGFSRQLEAVTDAVDNKKIIEALKDAQAKGTDGFKALENSLKGVSKENKVLQFAKNAQAGVKVGGILLSAAILGYFLPRLNIIKTKNKYKNNPDQKVEPPKPEPLAIFSNGVSIHRSSARNTFKSFFV